MREEEKFWKGLEELKQQVGALTDAWGRWVEGMVSPSAARTLRGLGYRIYSTSHRNKASQDGRIVAEYDTLISTEKDGNNILFVGEAKTNFSSDDVKSFLEKLPMVKKYLREFRDYRVIGFVAGVNYGEGVDKFALKQGMYVFKPAGEIMELDVPGDFEPKIWE